MPEKTRHKRQTLQDMTRPLKQWMLRHKDNPYPSKAEKMELVAKSQMTLTQVSKMTLTQVSKMTFTEDRFLASIHV